MSEQVNLRALRAKYLEKKDVLCENDIKIKEPFHLFDVWLNDALNTPEVVEANAACLATVDSEGKPSNRFVLIKDANAAGFTFFTNYGSRKANDIAHNPNVALTFYWPQLHRSVRVEGRAEKIPEAESLKYFYERPRASQIGALASAQSTKIPSREHLDAIEAEIKANLGAEGIVPLPNWGGYLVTPEAIEFWQGQSNRLHDRLRFRRGAAIKDDIDNKLVHQGENGWVYERLAP